MRQTALCVFLDGIHVLVAEVVDPDTGARFHRPVGGAIEPGETADEAVRREVREEIGVELGELVLLGRLVYQWPWRGRLVDEEAHVYLGLPDDSRLAAPFSPVVRDGPYRFPTVWRPLDAPLDELPLYPAELVSLLAEVS